MSNRNVKRRSSQAVALVLAHAIVFTSMPVYSAPRPAAVAARSLALAVVDPAVASGPIEAQVAPGATGAAPAAPATAPKVAAPPPPPKVNVNRTVPEVTPPSSVPTFSATPTVAEFLQARIFAEPFVPVGGEPSPGENAALAAAITTYHQRKNPDDVSAFGTFLNDYPKSAWRASVVTNLGAHYNATGFYTKATEALTEGWQLSKDEPGRAAGATAERALAELLDVHMQFGRLGQIEELMADSEGRDFHGWVNEQRTQATAAIYVLKEAHHEAIASAAVAVDQLQGYGKKDHKQHAEVARHTASHHGASLADVGDLAQRAGMPLRLARRDRGDFEPGSIVHLKSGHFSALVRQEDDRFLLADPMLDQSGEVWLSRAALMDEASGYALLPAASLPQGWAATARSAVSQIRGKCVAAAPNGGATGQGNDCPNGACGGGGMGPPMAVYRFHSMLVSLSITDTPVRYTPPRGPRIGFQLTYNQREAYQPSTFTFSNLGPRWNHDWLSYIEDTPANPPASAKVFMRGGGSEVVTGFVDDRYAPATQTRAILVRTSSSPIRYERQMPDGSIEVFAQSDSGTSPRRVFLTEWKDPAGNSAQLTYDSQFRIVSVTDAIGQVTTLSYGLTADPLKITKVTDPFGRAATFEYNATGALIKITDVIGITSEFTYGNGDFIRALITPYGTTTFIHGLTTWHTYYPQVWLEATDPLGGKERLERVYMPGAPGVPGIPETEPANLVPQGFTDNSSLNYRNSFYWDKRAMALHPGDYSKARITRWLWEVNNVMTISDYKHSEKMPLENRVWYGQMGARAADSAGPDGRPAKIGRVLDDGTSQIYRYEYNSKGQVTRQTDPLGRTTTYTYASNGTDRLEARRVSGQTTDLLASYTYNSQHQPLTITDAAGKTTTLTYNAQDQVLTITNAKNETTTHGYDTNGYLTDITRPASGATTTFTYDGHGRRRTATYSDGYGATWDYDALDRVTRVTYPDGTYEETVYNRLDPEKRRDRLGRWSHIFYDALRRVVATRDPLGRTTTQQWCTCGSLDKVIDAAGNAISWERDVQGRVTREVRADGSAKDVTYETTTSRAKQVKDAKNQTANFEYSLDNNFKRLSFTNAQNATADVSFTYDPVYNRAATMTDGTGTTSYAYQPSGSHGAGRVASVDGPLTNDTVSYTYDELGRLATRPVNGVSTSWSYDNLGRMTTEANSLGTFTSTYVGTTPRLDTVTYPNGQTTAYTYFGVTGDHLLQDLHNKLPGGVTLSRFTYTRDAEGNIGTWTQQAGAATAVAYDLAYDPAEALLAATLRTTGGSPSILKRYIYGYDKTGNRTSEQIDDAVTGSTYNNMNQLLSTQPGGALRFSGTVNEPATVTVGGTPATVDAANKFQGSATTPSGSSNVVVTATDPSGNLRTNTYQVSASGTTRTLTYDANGNLTSDGSRGFEWDANNLLTAVTQGARRTEFGYDGRGRRVRVLEKDGGSTLTDRRFIWAEGEMVEERDASSGAVLRRFFRHGIEEAGAPFFFTRDHLGSVREVTNQAASLVARYDYDPWGRMSQVSGTAPAVFGYTGQYVYPGSAGAPQAGLYFYKARYYAPDLGRFLNEDPKRAKNSPTFFAYANNNPANVVDPFGLAGVKCDTCPPPQQPNIQKAVSTFCSNAQNVKCKMGLKQLGLDKCVDDKCKDTVDVRCIAQGPDPDQCGGPAFPLIQNATKVVFLMPLQFGGPCPSLNFTIAHEMAHLCGIGPDAGPMTPARTAGLNRAAADNIGLVCSEP